MLEVQRSKASCETLRQFFWLVDLVYHVLSPPKTTAKLIQNNVYCFFTTIFRLAIPSFVRFTDVTELMQESRYYIDGQCRNKNCLKGRGGNDVQHKNQKGKIIRIWITIIRHGGLGHEIQESWPYLSNATFSIYVISV